MNIKSIISNKLRWRASFSKFSSPQNQRNNKYWGMAAFMHSDPELISDKECYCLWTLMIQWTLVYALNQLRRYSESLRAGRSGDRIPVGARFFRTRQDRTWGPPSLLHNGYQVIPRGKAAGAWSWLLTPSSAEVNERVELYLYSHSGPSWPPLSVQILNSWFLASWINVNKKVQLDAKVCRHLFTAKSLYMFRVSQHP